MIFSSLYYFDIPDTENKKEPYPPAYIPDICTDEADDNASATEILLSPYGKDPTPASAERNHPEDLSQVFHHMEDS